MKSGLRARPWSISAAACSLFGIGGQLQVVLHQGGLEAGGATAVLPVRLLQQLPAARERAGGQHAGYVDDHRGGFLSVA